MTLYSDKIAHSHKHHCNLWRSRFPRVRSAMMHDHAPIIMTDIAGYEVSHVDEELVKYAAAIAAYTAKALALV
jgi:hypothetical protein